jgi:hypothetical protein
VVTRLLCDLEETGRPEDELDKVGSQSPLPETNPGEELIEDELIEEEDGGYGAHEDSGLQLHDFEEVEATSGEDYEYIWKSVSSTKWKTSLLLKK